MKYVNKMFQQSLYKNTNVKANYNNIKNLKKILSNII